MVDFQDSFKLGIIKGIILVLLGIIVRFLIRRYKIISNKDLFIKHFNYGNSTDLEKIQKCLEYWVSVKNYKKIEQVAKRLIDFDYKHKFANEEIVKSIFFNRKYTVKDEMYFETILSDFSSLQSEKRSSMAIYLYLQSICAEQNGNNILSNELNEKAFDYNSNLKLEYPQYFNN